MLRRQVDLALPTRTAHQSLRAVLHQRLMHVRDGYQRRLDGLPRVTISLAGKAVSSWRTMGGIGLLVGAFCSLVLIRWRGVEPVLGLVIIGVNLATFRFVSRLSTRMARRRRMVLLENFVTALVATALTAHWLAAPVLAVLDVWALSMAAGLAIGRMGCLFVGCCHGRPARIGLSYPWRIQFDTTRSLRTVRFIPVQGYEILLLGAIFTSGLVRLLISNYHGDVFILFLIVYGVGRYGLEFLRGDARPYWRGLSEAQWTCLSLIGLSAVLAITAHDPTGSSYLGWSALGLLTIAGISLMARHQFGEPLFDPMHPDQVRDLQAASRARNGNLAEPVGGSDKRQNATIEMPTGLTITLSTSGQTAETGAYLLSGRRRRLDTPTAHAASVVLAHAEARATTVEQLNQVGSGVYCLVVNTLDGNDDD